MKILNKATSIINSIPPIKLIIKVLSIVLVIPCILMSQPNEAILLGSWDDPEIIGSTTYNNRYNEVWGFSINGHEYAVIGSTRGTHLIDVTFPDQPFEAFYIPGRSMGPHIIHRDYHDYQGYLYAIADEGNSSLQIIDLHQLPDQLAVVYDSNVLMKTAHNLFIDSSSAVMYLCAVQGGTSSYSPLRTVDLSNPIEPTFLNSFSNFGENYFISHVHDAYVENDTAFLNCGPNGLVIADFKDPVAPLTISIVRPSDYPQAGYNHGGWLSRDHRYYYLADENHGLDIKVFDLIDIYNPIVISTFNAESTSNNSIPHNLIVSCQHLFVSYYYDGYQVFDISQPSNPVRVSWYDTYPLPDGNSYKGAWGVYPFLPSGNVLVSDMQTGLYIFGPEESTGCDLVSGIELQVEYPLSEIEIYPTITRAGQQIHIKENGYMNSDQYTVEWHLLNGQEIFSTKINLQVNSLQVPNLIMPGLYIVQIKNEKIMLSKRVLIID